MSNREHWLQKVKPLGSKQVKIEYEHQFDATEVSKLRTGYWPRSMDDKWIVFLGDSSLDFWRSWTGHCIFSLPAQTTASGVSVGPLFVNNEPEQYRRVGDAEDIRLLERLLERFLAQ